MTWIVAISLSFAHARTAWRALGPDATPLQKFLRGRAPVALLVGPGAIDLALRFSAHTTGQSKVKVQMLRPDTDQDTLLALVENHSVKLILVMEDPSVRLEWGLRRRARLI